MIAAASGTAGSIIGVRMSVADRTRCRTVAWPGAERCFTEGERIHTENSYKYTLPGLTALLRAAGYTTVRTYTDPADRFALALAQ